ncbi:disease resistance protein RPV1-like [Fagus crenata]
MPMHVGEAIELPTPVSVSTSGTSERAVVEPMTIPPSRKKLGSRPINDEEIEIPCQTDSQQLLGQRRCVMSLSEFGVGNFNGLRFCVIRECPKIQTVIASKELSEAVFPILEHLSINYLSNFNRISEGMIPQGSFAKLRMLTIQTCPKFQFVFASSMLQIFSNLEELIVEDCPAIEEIIFQDRVVDSGSDTLPSLKRLKLHYLPRLVNIMKGTWPPLESISFYDCPRLKKLGIDSNTCHTLKEIKAENDWWEDLDLQDTLRLPLQARFTPICDNDL